MNYKRIYMNLMRFRKKNPLPDDVYGEKHHIIPISLGGRNIKNNLVKLSFQEHKFAHHLLEKIFYKRSQMFQSKKSAIQYKKMRMAYIVFLKNEKNKLMLIKYGKHNKQKVKEMFDYFIQYNCGNHSENYKKLQLKFHYSYEKSSLYQLFSNYGFKINDVIFKNKQNRYSEKQVETMYHFFIENKKDYNKTKQYFNYDGSNQSLRNLFQRFGFYKTKHRTDSLKRVKEMFLFYKDNDCGTQLDKYQEFQDTFNYSGTKRSLLAKFRHFGFYLDKYQYDKEYLQKMFDYYVEHRLYESYKSIDEFREKFNYPYKKKSLRVLFKEHNLIVPDF